jgi:hypothetical protein
LEFRRPPRSATFDNLTSAGPGAKDIPPEFCDAMVQDILNYGAESTTDSFQKVLTGTQISSPAIEFCVRLARHAFSGHTRLPPSAFRPPGALRRTAHALRSHQSIGCRS